jgi:pimeloyl-ACP methyl ester carboxylesterase
MTLERLNKDRERCIAVLSGAIDLDFLDPAWRNIMHGAIGWIVNQLDSPIITLDSWAAQAVQYAIELCDSIIDQSNFLAKHAGSKIPYRLTGADSQSSIINCLLTLPHDLESGKLYPMIIELHGGDVVQQQICFTAQPESFPYIQVYPVSERSGWDITALNGLLDQLKNILPIDENRVYIKGHSMGGFGAFQWAMHNPEHFAAICPCSGGGAAWRSSRLRNIAVWLIHGIEDRIIPMFYAETMLTAMQENSVNLKSSLLKGVDHDLRKAVDQRGIDQWLLQHVRSDNPIPDDPIDVLGLDERGVSQWKVDTISPQTYAVMQTRRDRVNDFWRRKILYKKLYDVQRNSGLYANGLVQISHDPALPDEDVNLLLALPDNIDQNKAPDGVKIISIHETRVVFLTIKGGSAKVNRHLDLLIPAIRQSGYNPTGEIRMTRLMIDPLSEEPINRVDLGLT